MNETYKTTTSPFDTGMPLAVLVNYATASAAEITSGSLQDYDRAVIVGRRTYGKGLVQTPKKPPLWQHDEVDHGQILHPFGALHSGL